MRATWRRREIENYLNINAYLKRYVGLYLFTARLERRNNYKYLQGRGKKRSIWTVALKIYSFEV